MWGRVGIVVRVLLVLLVLLLVVLVVIRRRTPVRTLIICGHTRHGLLHRLLLLLLHRLLRLSPVIWSCEQCSDRGQPDVRVPRMVLVLPGVRGLVKMQLLGVVGPRLSTGLFRIRVVSVLRRRGAARLGFLRATVLRRRGTRKRIL